MSSPWYRAAFGAHYPLLYAHRNQQEARRCLDLLHDLVPFPRSDLLLDLGCGDGRHLELLADDGQPAIGLDLSPHLLEAARARFQDKATPLLRGDMKSLPLADGSVAGVLSLFTAFGYFGPLENNAGVVFEVHRVLRPGGHWYLDYVDCDSVRRELSQGSGDTRQRNLGPLSVHEVRRLAKESRQVEKVVTLTPLTGQESSALDHGIGSAGVRYTESIALFSVEEIVDLARSLGLTLAAKAGSYEGCPLGKGTRWIMVFQKDTTKPERQPGAR